MASFNFIEQGAFGSGFIYKDSQNAYGFSVASFVITTGSGTNTVNISEVLSGTVVVGMTVSGGTLSGTSTIVSFGTFNGTSGTVVLSQTETFANPTTVSAEGFLPIVDPDYPPETVRGIVYLDGTYYVMTPSGSIYGSDIENPYSWSALNVIQSLSEPDGGVCLARQLNLVVAFGQYSTEFFYNAGNPTGSSLSPYTSSFLKIGCASAESVVEMENDLIFMSQGLQRGRAIQVLKGTVPTQISSPAVNRVLDADPLTDVNAFFIKLAGHSFYILCLTNVTLVYDFISQQWGVWTSLTQNASKNITAATWSNGVVTATSASHGYAEQEFVRIENANPSTYNGDYLITKVDNNTFTYEVTNNPGTYVGSATVSNFTEIPFKLSGYTTNGSLDLVQDSTTGSIFALSTGVFTDADLPIKAYIRTPLLDGGTNEYKFFSQVVVNGDTIDGKVLYRHTDDDYQTWSKYREIDMSKQRPQIYRLGRARRRAFELTNYSNDPLRLKTIEVSIGKGST